MAALAALRASVQVVALSNANVSDLTMLSANTGLAWHAVLSAELFGRYKPEAAVYRGALDLLRADPPRVMLAAAHTWDLNAAAEHGIRTAFVARPNAMAPTPTDRISVQVEDLAVLAREVGGAQEGV